MSRSPINKQTSPIFNCVTPVSVSLAKLAPNNIIYFTFLTELLFFYNDQVLNSGGSILVLLLFRVVNPEYAAT